jgi:signal transduction histidine kinase
VIINFSINPSASVLLDADDGLRRCVIEICREAASNAIRHGHAKTVDFEVKLTGGLIDLRATDDGEGISSVALPGLGSEMLDDTCMKWQLSALPQGGSELIAVLA